MRAFVLFESKCQNNVAKIYILIDIGNILLYFFLLLIACDAFIQLGIESPIIEDSLIELQTQRYKQIVFHHERKEWKRQKNDQ